MENKSLIFKACHELTRNLVKNTTFNYHVTFSACLKLYNVSNHDFIIACKFHYVDIFPLACTCDLEFEFYDILPLVDHDKTAKSRLDSLINFAVFYGLKKRDSFRTLLETVNNTVSDNYNPISVDNLRRNDFDDLKQEIVLYMLDRVNDETFQNLPNVFKLLRAGDCVVTNYTRKEISRAKNTCYFSDLEESGFQIEDKTDYFNSANIDGLIQNIASKLPKIHRQLAIDIIYLYCITGKGNISRKCRTQAEIAETLNISVRTVKTVWKEIIDLNPNTFRD